MLFQSSSVNKDQKNLETAAPQPGLFAVTVCVCIISKKEYQSYILTGVWQAVVEVTGDGASLTCLLIRASLFSSQQPRQQS